ncbi:MAG TPA: hypothetical protein VF771_06635 [Longimicrobiaceae bacterium]
MKKLRLDLDRLSVESFTPEPELADARGTVRAHAPTNINAHTCDPLVGTCFGFTCFRTCICTGPANPGGCGDHLPV